MLRITAITPEDATSKSADRTDADQRATLRIEGSLTASTAETLCAACRESLTSSPELVLDLAGVTFVDADGAACLQRLRGLGVTFHRTTPFVAALLNSRDRHTNIKTREE